MTILAVELVGLAAIICALSHPAGAQNTPHVLTCGRSRVDESEIRIGLNGTSLVPVWTWTPETSKGMPQELVKNFSTIDECKPTSGGTELLITSSHDAVALVSRKDGATLISARVKNAHSAILLSDNLVAVASSDARDGSGDRVVLFDRHMANVRLAELPIHAAHGLVWDEKRNLLWVLGQDQLMKTTVTRTNKDAVHVTVEQIFDLPEPTGHDLRFSNDCSTLYLSTTHHVYKFSTEDKRFVPFPPLANVVDVKSFSINPQSGQLVYTIADRGGYWTSTLRFALPPSTVMLPTPIYKTRWTNDLPPSCSVE